MKRPAFQFYPADWRKDAALQSCSMAAQGLWMNLLCVMHECEPYGHLTINGRALQPSQLARLVGLTPGECDALLQELQDAGVSAIAEDGSIFSRRMVRDEVLRGVRAASGRLGGNPSLLKTKDKQTPKQTPTPSSSSSSSSSEEKKPARKRATHLPDGFDVSQRVTLWALGKGFSLMDQAAQLEAFLSYAKRKGATYADWDEALMTAIREDWAKYRVPKPADIARMTVPADPRNDYTPDPPMTPEQREAANKARELAVASFKTSRAA